MAAEQLPVGATVRVTQVGQVLDDCGSIEYVDDGTVEVLSTEGRDGGAAVSYANRRGWITGTCATCGQFDYVIEDEVTDALFCEQHAGPLAWSDHDVDAYSLALKLAGMHDAPLPLPKIKAA